MSEEMDSVPGPGGEHGRDLAQPSGSPAGVVRAARCRDCDLPAHGRCQHYLASASWRAALVVRPGHLAGLARLARGADRVGSSRRTIRFAAPDDSGGSGLALGSISDGTCAVASCADVAAL